MTTTTTVPFSGSAKESDGSTVTVSGQVVVSTVAPAPSPPPPPPPAPTPTKPIFGFNDQVDGGMAAVATKLGCKPIPGAKMFNTGMPTSFPGLPTPAVTHPLFDFKPSCPLTSSDKSAIASLAKSIAGAAPNPMLCAFQEQEHLGFPIADVLAAHAEIYDIVKAAAPSVKYGQCLQSYSARPTGNNALAQWVAKRSNGSPLDFYGFDTYPWSATVTAGAVLDACLAQLKSAISNAVFAITELNYTSNITTSSIYSGGGAQWFSEAKTWADTNNPLLFYIFARTAREVPWPPDAATITELSNIAHAYGL